LDKNSNIREELLECIKYWILNLFELKENLKTILIILILFLSDEIDWIKKDSLNLILDLGNKYFDENENEIENKFKLRIKLKEPFHYQKGEEDDKNILPNFKSRRLIKNYSKILIQIVSDKIIQWDINIKLKYLKFLSNILIFFEEYSILYLKNIFMILLEALMDSNDLNLKFEVN